MSVYQFSCKSMNGERVALEAYRGQVLLIVNTASRCGFTPQYRGLETLYRDYYRQGFAVLAFPSGQFHQEYAADEDILNFCLNTYRVTFPLFAKVDVAGPTADPLFRYLSTARPGWLGMTRIKWNFTKFLVDRSGNCVRRFATTTYPSQLRRHIERALAGD